MSKRKAWAALGVVTALCVLGLLWSQGPLFQAATGSPSELANGSTESMQLDQVADGETPVLHTVPEGSLGSIGAVAAMVAALALGYVSKRKP